MAELPKEQVKRPFFGGAPANKAMISPAPMMTLADSSQAQICRNFR